ncbi:hypothetical protein, partial [Acidihalobacter prosperus]
MHQETGDVKIPTRKNPSTSRKRQDSRAALTCDHAAVLAEDEFGKSVLDLFAHAAKLSDKTQA